MAVASAPFTPIVDALEELEATAARVVLAAAEAVQRPGDELADAITKCRRFSTRAGGTSERTASYVWPAGIRSAMSRSSAATSGVERTVSSAMTWQRRAAPSTSLHTGRSTEETA